MSVPCSSKLFFLYGPSGSGKSTTGRFLAQALDLPFTDLDSQIETLVGKTVPDIFATEGETAFRQYEHTCLLKEISSGRGVVALGGGTLVNEQNRMDAEAAGQVLFLEASLEELEKRLTLDASLRPLLRNNSEDLHARLQGLLSRREEHYASFKTRINTAGVTPEDAAWQAQLTLGAFRVRGMGEAYDVRICSGALDALGSMLQERGLKGPVALVSDVNVAGLHAERASAALKSVGYEVTLITIPAGEDHKTLETVATLWQAFLSAGLERSSTVVALGGGVLSDLAGFAASTFLRGCRWVVVPTTLLSMADASLGGKTGFDLPQGKNLVGSFFPPSLVLSDPQTLLTLPEAHLHGGLGEVVKSGIIQDKDLYALCARGWLAVQGGDPMHPDWSEVVRRSAGVKVKMITQDPYEKGVRASLNLGHTIGHGLEQATHFALSHGEAVALGMVIEADIAEQLGLAEAGLAEEIAQTLQGLGLPTHAPAGIDRQAVRQAMSLDKKRESGKVRFALPIRIGEVKTGVSLELSDDLLRRI
jgi:shikimate kinase / 3-dehydroquinate synthase